jgi:arylformamidase
VTLVDLTHRITSAAHVPPGSPPVELRRLTTHERDRLQDTWLGLTVHAGTHLDAPLHAVPHGEDAGAISLERLIGLSVAWRIDCDSPREISRHELASAAPAARPGDRVLISTGWERLYERPASYRLHPHLSTEAAEWLVERAVTLVGVDTPTPDLAAPLRPAGFNYPVHRALLESGVLILENLANLDRVVGRRFRLLVCPLPIDGSDGAPARVLADLSGGES